MNVSTIQMDAEQAREKYKEYLEKSRKIKSKEYAAARRAYRAMSKGLRIIDIYAAFEKTGAKSDLSGPKLAIVRADSKEVVFVKERNGGGRFCMPDNRSWGEPNRKTTDVSLPANTFEPWPTEPGSTWSIKDNLISTNVPFIPANILVPGELQNYYILFEVNAWKKHRPTKDPYLLQRLNENTFVVLAEWDVSPVEAIIMRA